MKPYFERKCFFSVTEIFFFSRFLTCFYWLISSFSLGPCDSGRQLHISQLILNVGKLIEIRNGRIILFQASMNRTLAAILYFLVLCTIHSQPISSPTTVSQKDISDWKDIRKKIADISSIPTLPQPSPISTGTITVSAQPNSPAYFLPFSQPQTQLPRTIVGLSSFSTEVGQSLTFTINKVKSNLTGISFEVHTEMDKRWDQMRLTFLSATTPAVQIGQASYNLNDNNLKGYLTYKLKNSWQNPQSLKTCIFLSSLSIQGKPAAMGYQITHQYMQDNLVIIRYQTPKDSTVQQLTLDLLVFDPLNQLVRFQHALLAQTFLTAPITLPLPPTAAQQTIFMAGIADLIIEGDSRLTLTSEYNGTSFTMGPIESGCHFNYLSLSFLIMVYNPCGFCNDKYIVYKGRCLDSCPHGTAQQNFTCVPIVCPEGTYLSQANKCEQCPKRSNIEECHNSCNEDEYLSGQKCFPLCQPSLFLQFHNGSCVCMPSYHNISGICQQCPLGTKYDSIKCISICSQREDYSLSLGKCQCKQGWYRIGEVCGKCLQSQNYVASRKACLSKCREDEQYRDGACVCDEGRVRADNKSCVLCPDGTGFNRQKQSCLSVCSINQTFINGQCVCKQSYYRIGDQCSQCPPRLLYNSYLKKCRQPCPQYSVYNDRLDQCSCKSTFNMVGNQCQCPQNATFSSAGDQCLCSSGFNMTLDAPFICQSICQNNETYVSGKCVCQLGTFRIAGKCTTCPPGTVYDLSFGVCHHPCTSNQTYSITQDTCACKAGFYLIKGVCSQCLQSQTYSPSSSQCLKKCPSPYEQYSPASKTCQCLPSAYLINGKCQPCPEGQFFFVLADGTKKCFYNCKVNETFNPTNYRCECKSGYYMIGGQCGQCASGMKYNVEKKVCQCADGYGLRDGVCVSCGPCSFVDPLTGKCECKSGFLLISGICSTCPIFTVYDPTTKNCLISCPEHSTFNAFTSSCSCSSGYYMSANNVCLKQCPQDQQHFINNHCECLNSSLVLYKGECLSPLECPNHSYFHEESYCCLCEQGFRLVDGFCQPFSCGEHSYDYHGMCVCEKEYFMVRGHCQQCQQNEVYNGVQCVCLAGYTRNQGGLCVSMAIPVCKTNEVYNYTLKNCVCRQGYQFFMGSCQSIPSCPAYSDWNGVACQCRENYLMSKGQCQETNNVLPSCPQNSYFNGVSCNCQPGYYPIKPGYCGLCPPQYHWNGEKCTELQQCSVGYVISPFDGVCIPVGQLCGQGAHWNGVTCCCLPGYNNIDNVCVKCPSGTYFDGQSCSFSAVPCPSNQVSVSGECVCMQGFYRMEGVCSRCPAFTVWNGNFCSCPGSNPSVWCLGIPFSVQTQSGCSCQAGYFKLNGMCVRT